MRYAFDQILERKFSQMERRLHARALNLGASSSGLGGPAGGFIGYLPQDRVSYDVEEIASSGIPSSGISLVDNLNHVRYRLDLLESGGAGITVEEENIVIASGVSFLNFEGNANVVNDGGDHITVTISGGDITIQEDDLPIASGVNIVNFEGDVIVTNNGGGKTTILVTTSGDPGTDELVKISSNDTTANYLFNKVVAGSGITIAELNDGSNEQLRITSSASPSDELVKISSNDTTSNYLFNKIVAGSGISLSEIDDGGDETLQITASGVGGDSSRVLIATATPTGTSVSFTDIPQIYTHLRIESIARTDKNATAETTYVALNGDTTDANYRNVYASSNGSTVTAGTADARTVGASSGATATAGEACYQDISIPYYTNTTFRKNLLTIVRRRDAATTQIINYFTVWWENTAAITRIDFTTDGGNFVAGTTFKLYGLT